MIILLQHSHVKVKQLLGTRAKPYMKLGNCIEKLIKSKSVACSVDNYFVLSNKLDHLVHDEIPVAHIIEEELGNSLYTHVMKNGFMYKEKFYFVKSQLIESGILEQWIKKDINKVVHKIHRRNKYKIYIVFNWYIMCSGLVTIVFLGELFIFYTKLIAKKFFNSKIGKQNILATMSFAFIRKLFNPANN